MARETGLPIGDIVLATNAEPGGDGILDGGAWQPRASIATLASAMDVGNPSNMERLRALFPDHLRDRVSAELVTDDEIRATIRRDAEALGSSGSARRHRGARVSPAARGTPRRTSGLVETGIPRSSTRSWSR